MKASVADDPSSIQAWHALRVGNWCAIPRSGEIWRDGRVTHLEPKSMDVLLALWQRPGEVVLRSELLDEVWGSGPAASDESLTRSISLLRKALGDSPQNPRYIQTVAKRGYRALVPGSPVGRQVAAQPEAAITDRSM